MIGMILVTHGRLAEEFVHAMEHVVGTQADVATVCIGPQDDMELKRKEIAKAIKHLSDRIDRLTAVQRQYLSRSEVAALLGIDRATLQRIEKGAFGPPPKRLMIGGAPKYRAEDVHAWAASRPAPFGVKPSDFKPGKTM